MTAERRGQLPGSLEAKIMPPLTFEENKVVQMSARGHTVKEIEQQLHDLTFDSEKKASTVLEICGQQGKGPHPILQFVLSKVKQGYVDVEEITKSMDKNLLKLVQDDDKELLRRMYKLEQYPDEFVKDPNRVLRIMKTLRVRGIVPAAIFLHAVDGEIISETSTNSEVEPEGKILPPKREKLPKKPTERRTISRGGFREEEREVLRLIRMGLTDEQVAEKLSRSRSAAGKDQLSKDRSEMAHISKIREDDPAALHEARVIGARKRFYDDHVGFDLKGALDRLNYEQRTVLDVWINNPQDNTAKKLGKLLIGKISSSSQKKVQNIFGEAYKIFDIKVTEERKKIQLEAVYADALKFSVDKKTSSE